MKLSAVGLRKDTKRDPRRMHPFSKEYHFTLTVTHLRIIYPLIHIKYVKYCWLITQDFHF